MTPQWRHRDNVLIGVITGIGLFYLSGGIAVLLAGYITVGVTWLGGGLGMMLMAVLFWRRHQRIKRARHRVPAGKAGRWWTWPNDDAVGKHPGWVRHPETARRINELMDRYGSKDGERDR